MPVQILIPTPLRPFTNAQAAVTAEGHTVGDALISLTTEFGDLRNHLYGADGRLRNFVNVYLNDDDIRYLQREETPISPGDTISIIPSVAGGSGAAVEEPPSLSHEEVQRYSRHLIIPEVGVEGQLRLKKARVVCVGAGGLGPLMDPSMRMMNGVEAATILVVLLLLVLMAAEVSAALRAGLGGRWARAGETSRTSSG